MKFSIAVLKKVGWTVKSLRTLGYEKSGFVAVDPSGDFRVYARCKSPMEAWVIADQMEVKLHEMERVNKAT